MSEATFGSKIYVGGIATWSAVATVVVIAAMFVTNPTAIGPFVATAWFILLFAGLTGWLTIGLYYLSRRFGNAKTLASVQLKTAVRRGSLLAAWPTVMLAMSSLGQLGLRDVILSAILLALLELYLRAKL